MSATPHSSLPLSNSALAKIYSVLPPVAITRQALFQFNLSIYQQLAELEERYVSKPQPMAFFSRQSWQPPLRKPR